jgi:hypothetical protein
MSAATTIKQPTTTTSSGKTTKAPYNWSKFGYSRLLLFTKPLTLEAIDHMVPHQEVLGAIALTTTAAATTMGLYN